MLASYFLSRTLVPTMVNFLLKSEVELYQQGAHGETAGGKGLFWRVHYIFNTMFESLRYPFGQKTRRTSSIVFEVEIIGPPLSNSTIAGVRNGRPEYKLAHDA
jgi:hypothetical protein